MYIGIIGAMEEEILFLESKLLNIKIEIFNNTTFKIGRLYNKDVILCVCNEGKVNSAIASQIMISNFDISYMINIGLAGSVDSKVEALDVVIASKLAQHDYDISALGYENGLVLGINKKYIDTSSKSIEVYNYLKKIHNNIHYESIASGDIFVSNQKYIDKIKQNFDVVAVDMESAAIAHVCSYNKIEFLCIRVISDTSSSDEFRQFLNTAINSLDNIINSILNNVEM